MTEILDQQNNPLPLGDSLLTVCNNPVHENVPDFLIIKKRLENIQSLLLIEAPTRFELVIEVLQTFALPLGYGATASP